MKENQSGVDGLLLADLNHFGESLWRNDEIGERRFNFFVTLAAAVMSGLATLYAAKDLVLAKGTLLDVSRGALGALFVFGLLTYLRLLHRNRVNQEYHRTLKYIRNRLCNIA